MSLHIGNMMPHPIMVNNGNHGVDVELDGCDLAITN